MKKVYALVHTGEQYDADFWKNEIGGFYQPVTAGNFCFHPNYSNRITSRRAYEKKSDLLDLFPVSLPYDSSASCWEFFLKI